MPAYTHIQGRPPLYTLRRRLQRCAPGCTANDQATGTPLDPDVRVHRALADETRAQLMRMLHSAPDPPDAHQLAQEVGLHVTTVRAHLDVLADAGLVTSETESRATPGRPRRLYRASPDAPSVVDADGYRLLAEMLVGHLAGTSTDAVQDAMAVGREWGAFLVERPPPHRTTSSDTARAELLDLMERLGFRPEVAAGGTQILLRRCPFIEIARDHPDVVCSVHLGILRGALQTLGAVLEARDLEPFAQPSLCVAHLTEAQPALP